MPATSEEAKYIKSAYETYKTLSKMRMGENDVNISPQKSHDTQVLHRGIVMGIERVADIVGVKVKE